jgi:hypothetical protein
MFTVDKNVFCSSPWLHIRLTYSGEFVVCRWQGQRSLRVGSPSNISNTSIVEYFNSHQITNTRNQLLNGELPELCQGCLKDEKAGAISGRKKQLFRSKINNNTFYYDFLLSPHYEEFKYSIENAGKTNAFPFDFQIDVENICNSACIMCHPMASSRLATDYIKLHKIDPQLFSVPKKFDGWAHNPVLVQKFITELKELPFIDYIHLLGGETLYSDSLYTICNALIEADLAKYIIIGTTTNGTIYDKEIERIIPKFREFHLGVSIESTNPLNDYIRYPGEINSILKNIHEFLLLRVKHPTLHLTLRTTPNIFSIYYIDEVIQFMIDNNITSESCRILTDPSVLRIELIPNDIKLKTINKLNDLASRNNISRKELEVDTRDKSKIHQVISNVLYQQIDFLTNMKPPDNVEEERYKLVKFLKAFEQLRGNSILDYAPEYTEFLKQYGY